MTCFGAAVPFFRHTLESDLLFTPIMFATPAMLRVLGEILGKESEPTAAV